MHKNNNANPNGGVKRKKDKKVSSAGLWIVIAVGILVLIIVLYVGTFHVNQYTARIRFIAENTLTAVLAILVAVQAYIYRRQWEIMRAQAESMDKSVVFGLRAYVGIHSMGIDLEEQKHIVIQIENIGKVPASAVKIAGELQVMIAKGCISDTYKPSKWSKPEAINHLRVPLARDYGRTKLFPGNLKIKIIVALRQYFTDGEISLIRQGDARLIIRGNINFEDGFHRDKNSPFAFRYSKGAQCCLPYPIETPEEDWDYKPGEDQDYW